MYFINSVILIVVSVLLYVYWLFKKTYTFFDRNGIPYLKPTWLLGNMGDALMLKKPLAVVHLELYRKLEPYKFAGLFTFHKPSIMVRDPELIKHILIKDFSHFHDRGFPVNKEIEPLGNHLLSMRGEEWKNLRIKLTSTFTAGKMKLMFPLVKECGDKFTQVLETIIGEPFDVKDLCARYTTDVIGTCAFGIETHSLDDPESQFRTMGKRVFEFRYRALLRSLYPDIPKSVIQFFNLKFLDENVEKFFFSIVENTVKYREQNKITRYDFIDLLLALKNHTMEKYHDQHEKSDVDDFLSQLDEKPSKSNIEMTIDLMAAQSFLFFGAGFETSSTALGFLMLELAINKVIQNKVRDEIKTAVENNNGEITYELLKNIPYVDMVIAETLRKYPPAGILIRQCTINYKLPNTKIVIPEKMPVIIPLYGIHMDGKYYKKPNEFYPEHFTEEAKAERPHYTYLPFGEGPRACIAERFAKMQVKVGLISMMQKFSYDVSPNMTLPVQFQPNFGLLTAKGGIWLRCQKI